MHRWQADRSGNRPFWTLLFGCVLGITLATAARGQDQPSQSDLYLEVYVNGQPRDLITRFTMSADGRLSADAEELRNSGVLPDGGATKGEVHLDQIAGLGWRLIEPEQTIRFIVPDELLAPRVMSAGTAEPLMDQAADPAQTAIDHGYGVVLNYALNYDTWEDVSGRGSGSFDSRLFTPLGTLTHGFALTQDGKDSFSYRRLDSYWRSSFPGRQVQVQIGDLATRGLSWSRPVRLGGIMAERNFGLRPDLVTLPLPSFEGSAALPSTVEIYSGAMRAYAGEVPAGPFVIENLPLAVGGGMAQVVVRDAAGRETQLDLPFLVSDALLRRGMADFALAAGRPRLGIGSQTDRYGEEVFGVGTLRYGVTDGLTMLLHAEGGKNLAMAGLGVTFPLGHLGTTTLSFGQSRTQSGRGRLVDISATFNLGRAQFTGRVMKTDGAFRDIAAVVADPDMVSPILAAFPEHIAQASFSMPLGGRSGAGANLFASDASYAAQDGRESSFGASYQFQVMGNASLSLTALAQRGIRHDTTVGAQLHISLGQRRDVSTSLERGREGWRHYVGASGRSKGHVPGWDWQAQASRETHSAVQGRIGRTGSLGRVEIAVRQSHNNSSAGMRLDGSVVGAGGGLFLSRRVDDAFAVVDAGAPDIEVRAENRPVGRTGRSGKILVPDLRAYEDNIITIDPLDLPLDAAIEATRQVVRPAHHAGTRVDFGVETGATQALVELLDMQGHPLEVGGQAVLNGIEGDLLVGFDGEIFLEGVGDTNRLTVSYPDGRSCQAQFDYADEPGTITEIRGVPCV